MADFGIFRGFSDKLFEGQLPTELGLIGSQDSRGINPTYQAVLDYATTEGYTLPSVSQQSLQNKLIVDLKEANIWDKLDALYIMATDGDSDFACINYVEQNNFNLIKLNSVVFQTNEGFKGDGASASLNTSINLGVNTSNFNVTTRSASFGGWSYFEKASSANALMGEEANINNIRGGSSDAICGALASSTILTNGLYHMNSFAGSAQQYINGEQVRNTSNNNLTSVYNLHLLGEGGNTFGTDTISIAFVGGDLSEEASDLYNIFNSYISSI